ncbi:MAG: hypothetical protein AVDCRST_MAG38-295, partial [uncultured Solirubrobacteraceae bacterium]
CPPRSRTARPAGTPSPTARRGRGSARRAATSPIATRCRWRCSCCRSTAAAWWASGVPGGRAAWRCPEASSSWGSPGRRRRRARRPRRPAWPSIRSESSCSPCARRPTARCSCSAPRRRWTPASSRTSLPRPRSRKSRSSRDRARGSSSPCTPRWWPPGSRSDPPRRPAA